MGALLPADGRRAGRVALNLSEANIVELGDSMSRILPTAILSAAMTTAGWAAASSRRSTDGRTCTAGTIDVG